MRTQVIEVQQCLSPPSDVGVDISAGGTKESIASAASMMTSSAAAKASISFMRQW
jgi:hypothetical protein